MRNKPTIKPLRHLRHLRAGDLRGIAQLGTQATSALTRITEQTHQSVLATLGDAGTGAPGRTSGITGLVYRCIQGVNRLVGLGLDASLARLQPLFDKVDADKPGTPQREAMLAALNGVMGDHLLASGNPLATPMSLRHQGLALTPAALAALAALSDTSAPGCRLVIFIHGLGMSDLQWRAPVGAVGDAAGQAGGASSDHALALAQTLGCTALDLRYNTGLHVSHNGRELAALLEALVRDWPTPLDELSIVAHSMGGLVARSAVDIAQQQSLGWTRRLRHLVFLGTPHHGAPLERAGHWIGRILGATPYSAPLAKLGQLRSAGVTDLRHGLVRDEDWLGRDRFARHDDPRHPMPLPKGVACHAVAATLGSQRGKLAESLLGDGLVPLRSALGQHEQPALNLDFAPARTLTLYGTGHMALLHHPEVTRQLLEWMAAR